MIVTVFIEGSEQMVRRLLDSLAVNYRIGNFDPIMKITEANQIQTFVNYPPDSPK